jgi:hypothetical protein
MGHHVAETLLVLSTFIRPFPNDFIISYSHHLVWVAHSSRPAWLLRVYPFSKGTTEAFGLDNIRDIVLNLWLISGSIKTFFINSYMLTISSIICHCTPSFECGNFQVQRECLLFQLSFIGLYFFRRKLLGFSPASLVHETACSPCGISNLRRSLPYQQSQKHVRSDHFLAGYCWMNKVSKPTYTSMTII